MKALRSVLYLPGSKMRVLEKARDLSADALIFDLEDAVAPDEKSRARDLVQKFITEGGYGQRTIIVRINGLNTPWGEADLAMALEANPNGILLPKVETKAEVNQVASQIKSDKTTIYTMIETPLGVENVFEISQSNNIAGFVLGTNDLAKELRAHHVTGREPLLYGLSRAVMAARVAGIACIDGVYNAFKDEEGLRNECVQGLQFGMDGKTLIHPGQIDIANQIFSPDEKELELAHRQVQAFEDAIKQGEAIAVVDGSIVENLHAENAKRIIALDQVIKSMSNE